ncbi:MAG TPA: hypothetical protein H9733_08260 [Candidatus Anaerotignum merdipullorum]|nr:hypothetical protein [Candidatus Anaerotignum merdipullorum]
MRQKDPAEQCYAKGDHARSGRLAGSRRGCATVSVHSVSPRRRGICQTTPTEPRHSWLVSAATQSCATGRAKGTDGICVVTDCPQVAG